MDGYIKLLPCSAVPLPELVFTKCSVFLCYKPS